MLSAHRNGFREEEGKRETEKDRLMLDIELEKEGGFLTADNLKRFLKGEHIIKIESASDLLTGRQKGKARLCIRAEKSRGGEIKAKLQKAGVKVREHKVKEVRKNSVPMVAGMSWDNLALQQVHGMREVNEDAKLARTLKRNVSHISVVGAGRGRGQVRHEEVEEVVRAGVVEERAEAEEGGQERTTGAELVDGVMGASDGPGDGEAGVVAEQELTLHYVESVEDDEELPTQDAGVIYLVTYNGRRLAHSEEVNSRRGGHIRVSAVK